jgi:hypothetical protein
MSIAWSDVTAIAPELSTVGSGSQNAILLFVNSTCVESEFGSKYTMGASLLAAHFGTLSVRGDSVGGPVVSESVGGVSQSFAVFSPNGSDYALDSTSYGRMYRFILRNLACRFPSVI